MATRRRARFRAMAFAAWLAMPTSAVAQTERNFDPIRTLPDGQITRIERIEDIPRQLARAAKRHCRLDESQLRELSIAVFRPAANARVLALVPCGTIIWYHMAFVFQRVQNEPDVLGFSVVDAAGGFTVSERPGVMTWDPSTKTLVARGGNDMCTASVARHTYRYAPSQDAMFTLIRVERGQACRGDDAEWTVVWEAQPWPADAR
jgi:hypothetical protein